MNTTIDLDGIAQRRKLARKNRAEKHVSRELLMTDFPHFFTVDETAQYLRKSRKFVEKLIHSNALDSIDVGQGTSHSWLIPFDAILKFTGHVPLNLNEIGEIILTNKELREIIIQSVSERILKQVYGAMNQALSDRVSGFQNREVAHEK